MSRILVTGFTPFDGRQNNASWIAASSLHGPDIRTVEIPVVWGAATKFLDSACVDHCPDIIISLGEG
ncbi:MAG: pyroglutamyl-peptidase I, partial [Gammaproteobacteria bacterium]|nr:pyroglutamyl-peptidase I [Gammaproteobacteria bacterium]